MEGKDNRSKQKRKHMKQFKKHHKLKPDKNKQLQNTKTIQEIEESDSESDSDRVVFSRRTIESNWSRYEETEPSGKDRFAKDPDPRVPKSFYKRVDSDKSKVSDAKIHRLDAAAVVAEHKYKNLRKQQQDKKATGSEKQSPSEETEVKPGDVSKKHNKAEEVDELDQLLNMTSSVANLNIEENVDVITGKNATEDVKSSDHKNLASNENLSATNPQCKGDLQQWLDAILDD